MKNQKNNNQRVRESRGLPFFIEFAKFSAGFAAIIAAALFTLHIANAAMQ